MDAPLLDLMKDKSELDRTFKRYRVNFPMHVRGAGQEAARASFSSDPGELSLPALAHNISLSGIGFVCPASFDLASLIEIEITLESQSYSLLARIRWCRPLDLPGASMQHYGAQFLRTEAVLRFIPAAAQFLLAHSGERPVRHGSAAPRSAAIEPLAGRA